MVTTVAVAASLGLSACSQDMTEIAYAVAGYQPVSGFGGAVVADETRAATIARSVLADGGNATDAAVALYFSLAVTLPSTAGLGGGGSCIVYDPQKHQVETIDFPARAPAKAGSLAIVVPANARGMYILHTRHGGLPWSSLLTEAEQMAREGVPVSRALARDLAKGYGRLAHDPAAVRVFSKPDGSGPLGEGDTMINPELGVIMANLRRSPGDFYLGQMGHMFSAQAASLGTNITPEDLKAVQPAIGAGTRFALGGDTVVLPAGMDSVKAVFDALKGMSPDDRNTALANKFSTPDSTSPPLIGSSFAVLDAQGGAVACGVSMNGLFGIGRSVPGSGILLAPKVMGRPGATPALSIDTQASEFHFAGGASNGGNPAASVLTALLNTVDAHRPVTDTVVKASLSEITGGAGRTNGIGCDKGILDADHCKAAAASLGGYGARAEHP